MPNVTLVNPLSSAHYEFADYVGSSLERAGAKVTRIGAMESRRSSPNVVGIIIEFLRRRDRFARLKITISRQSKVYLFVDLFLVIDVLLSSLTKSPIVLYVHENRIFGRSLSSKVKQRFYRLVLERCVRMGPKEAHRVHLLFGRPLEEAPGKENMVLCFGTWIKGKVSNNVQGELQELRNKGFKLVRMGVTHDKTLLDEFDQTVDRFIEEEEKQDAFRRAKYLYLPYTPTNESGVIVDCLNNYVRVILGEENLPQDYVLFDIGLSIKNVGTEQKFNFQEAYNKLDGDNLQTLSQICMYLKQV